MASILIVEDNEGLRGLMTGILAGAGHAVTAVSTARDAIEKVASLGTLDLIIADAVLPDGNGLVTARELVENAPEVRLLGISGYPRDWVCADLVLRVTSTAAAYLEKPFSPSQLEAKVNELLARPQQAPATPSWSATYRSHQPA
jgi:DNA-binding response OmpR family regulator